MIRKIPYCIVRVHIIYWSSNNTWSVFHDWTITNNIMHRLLLWLGQESADSYTLAHIHTTTLHTIHTHRADSSWSRWTGQADHFLDSKTQFQSMQRVANADLLLYLLIRQRRHYGTTFDVGMTSGNVPCWHTHPQLHTVTYGIHNMCHPSIAGVQPQWWPQWYAFNSTFTTMTFNRYRQSFSSSLDSFIISRKMKTYT